MSKDTFQFKEFSIFQKGATLKICTDSCLFGAWAAKQNIPSEKVLDIGSGTGLLSLMFIQKNLNSTLTGIEIDATSASLTDQNFKHSPWSQQLRAVNISLQNFENADAKFDVIICNPPFFENQLESSSSNKNLAKHSSELKREELVEAINKLLNPTGTAFLLFPPDEGEIFIKQGKQEGLYLTRLLKVSDKKESAPIRYLMAFQKMRHDVTEESMYIYEGEKQYSSDFIKLLKDYYLYL